MPEDQIARLTPGSKVRVTTRATDALSGVQWIRDTIDRLNLGSWSCEFGLERDISVGSEVWVEGVVSKRTTPEDAAEFGEHPDIRTLS